MFLKLSHSHTSWVRCQAFVHFKLIFLFKSFLSFFTRGRRGGVYNEKGDKVQVQALKYSSELFVLV